MRITYRYACQDKQKTTKILVENGEHTRRSQAFLGISSKSMRRSFYSSSKRSQCSKTRKQSGRDR
jgi:hypothetical protein